MRPRSETFEVIVFAGDRWQRFADCIFVDRRSAELAANGIAWASTMVKTSQELDVVGLPEGPPPEAHR